MTMLASPEDGARPWVATGQRTLKGSTDILDRTCRGIRTLAARPPGGRVGRGPGWPLGLIHYFRYAIRVGGVFWFAVSRFLEGV